MENRRIAVVGMGVIGLTCAIRLRESFRRVDLYSAEDFSKTNSQSAGAYWWPHAIYPRDRVREWARDTYLHYERWRDREGTGIHFENHVRLCIDPDDNSFVRELIGSWEEVDGAAYGVNCHEAFRIEVPVIDVPVYLKRLRETIAECGVEVRIQKIGRPEDLSADYPLVINCTGVGAREFVTDDQVFPIRGQIVRGTCPKGLRESIRIYQRQGPFTLVLPRNRDVVLGGTAQEGSNEREPDPADSEEILRRCSELVPEVAQVKVIESVVGLRPGRFEVRLEKEIRSSGLPVIHNYGHGGGGFTVAWGCAGEVVDLATEHFRSVER